MSVTSSAQNKNCMDVSHANVTITLIGNNKLLCGITNYGALVKNGMDDTELVIQCEHAGEKGHRCTKKFVDLWKQKERYIMSLQSEILLQTEQMRKNAVFQILP